MEIIRKKGLKKSRIVGHNKTIGYTLLVFIVLLGITLIYIRSYSVSNDLKKQNPNYCTSSRDCIPDSCCHASGCVNKEHAPECSDVACSQECMLGTMDCGQGKCECVGNVCSVSDSSQIANPASVYCEENGGNLSIKTESDGSQKGICSLNGKECEEWAYYRGECSLK